MSVIIILIILSFIGRCLFRGFRRPMHHHHMGHMWHHGPMGGGMHGHIHMGGHGFSGGGMSGGHSFGGFGGFSGHGGGGSHRF